MHRLSRLTLLFMFSIATSAFAQWQPTQLKDTSALKPPAGAKVAIVEFLDLECPVCAQMDPAIEAAASQHHVAWVHHDFPLPMHNWSFAAAVNARFFDSKSPVLGNQYRSAVFANGVALPFILDPGEKFSNEVKADRDLARRMDIQRTPTIFVVAETSSGPTFTELLDRNQLDSLIEQEKAKVGPVKTAAMAKGHGK